MAGYYKNQKYAFDPKNDPYNSDYDWTEEVDADKIKVEKGIYTERMPFINIICFCKIFQLLFWDNIICETELTENEKSKIICQLKAILKDFNMDMNFD